MTLTRTRGRLPGAVLPDGDDWERRHRLLLGLLVVHVPVLALLCLVAGLGLQHVAVEVLPLAAAALLASRPGLPRGVREALVAGGLVASAAVVVHLSHGVTEAHFYFFVVLALVPLYQTWPPLALAVGLTVLHHAVVGGLVPERVFGDDHAPELAWAWAAVHGLALLAAAAAAATVIVVGERQRARLTEERDAARTAGEAALRELAQRDPLTGVPNRRLLDERLRAALDDGGAGVLLLDLDRFKAVNDVHGHEQGDDVLRRCARALTGAVRPGDLLARYGGDEFVAVCPGLLDPRALEGMSRRLSAAVADAVGADGVGVSIGTAVALPGEQAEAVLARADRAMYTQKRARSAQGGGHATEQGGGHATEQGGGQGTGHSGGQGAERETGQGVERVVDLAWPIPAPAVPAPAVPAARPALASPAR